MLRFEDLEREWGEPIQLVVLRSTPHHLLTYKEALVLRKPREEFYAWSEEYVFFQTEYDGEYSVDAKPRNYTSGPALFGDLKEQTDV